MIRKKLFYSLGIVISLQASTPESEIGINIGMTATENEPRSKFENPTFGITYQDNTYVVMPRVDLEYVKLTNEEPSGLFKASLNGVYEYENYTKFYPYVLAGIGYEQVLGGVEDVLESHFFVQGGGGVTHDLYDGYKVNIEGKFLQILGGNNEENEVILSAGVSIPLSFEREVREKRVVKRMLPKPIEPILVKNKSKIIYSNNNECSIKIGLPDFDRDGISNTVDQCPATPCNFSVDEYGCPIKATLKVNFANNSAEIRDYSFEKINTFAKFLLKNKGSMIMIEGHTDSVGSANSNLVLSDKRAKAVREVLINNGVSPSRIQSQGKGEQMPIASNNTADGKALNRRIEAILSYPKGRR